MRDVSINRFQMGPSTHTNTATAVGTGQSSLDYSICSTSNLEQMHIQLESHHFDLTLARWTHTAVHTTLNKSQSPFNSQMRTFSKIGHSLFVKRTLELLHFSCTRLALERNGNYKILMISSWSIAIAWALGNDMDSEQYFGSIHKFIHMRREEALRDRMCVQWTNHLVLTTKLAFSTTLVSILVRLSLSLVLFPWESIWLWFALSNNRSWEPCSQSSLSSSSLSPSLVNPSFKHASMVDHWFSTGLAMVMNGNRSSDSVKQGTTQNAVVVVVLVLVVLFWLTDWLKDWFRCFPFPSSSFLFWSCLEDGHVVDLTVMLNWNHNDLYCWIQSWQQHVMDSWRCKHHHGLL